MMKRAVTFQLIKCFLVVAITASAVYGEKEAVLDFEGNPVKANATYQVGRRGISGGVLLPYKLKDGCSKGVAMFTNRRPTSFNGMVVVFVSSSDVVRVSTQLKIYFRDISTSPILAPCSYSASEYWRVGQSDSDYEDLVIVGGVSMGDLFPGKSSNERIFTIEKSNKVYKFASGGVDIGLEKESLGKKKLRLLKDYEDLAEFAFFPAPM